MNDMVELVARAITAVVKPTVRRNKARRDGLWYEVVLFDEAEPISEETKTIVVAYATLEAALDEASRLFDDARARAAIAAMREPTEAMLAAGDSMMPQIVPGQDITTGRDALADAWPAMIDAALGPAQGAERSRK